MLVLAALGLLSVVHRASGSSFPPSRAGDLQGPAITRGLTMTIRGVEALDDEEAWSATTGGYIMSYFNLTDVDAGVFDVTVSIQVTNHIGSGGDNLFQHVNVTYDQTSTYKTADAAKYDHAYVATKPFSSGQALEGYFSALRALSPYYKDVSSAEPEGAGTPVPPITEAPTLLQQQLLSILPRITGIMSWLGSLSIVIDVIRKYRKRGTSDFKPTVYHQLMLGMSICDMSSSGALMMTTWPIPAGTPGAYAAYGNEATCNAQGAFMQFGGVGAPLYNLCLSIYYYLFIVKGKPPSPTLARCMHFFCISFPMSTAVASLALDMFGYVGYWCWITAEFDIFRYLFTYGPVWFSIVCVSVIMSSIYYNLWKQENRQRRWKRERFKKSTSPRQGTATQSPTQPTLNNNNEDGTVNNEGPTTANRNAMTGNNQMNRRRSVRVSDSVKWQAFWYVGGFFLPWFFLTIVRVMGTAGSVTIPYWLSLLASTLFPSQGAVNHWVYIRPRYKQHRKKFPQVGRLVTLFRISPLFTGFRCCHGRPVCTGKCVRLPRFLQIRRNVGEPPNMVTPSPMYLSEIEYNSQEYACSEPGCEEGRQVVHDDACQIHQTYP